MNSNIPYVKSDTKTTLEISSHWFPVRVMTAKETICSLMRERIEWVDGLNHNHVCVFHALDADLNNHNWSSWYENRSELIASGRYPLLKTANRTIPVPTILRIMSYHDNPSIHKVSRKVPSLQELLVEYDYTCMLTGVRYDPSEFDPKEIFNKDHVLPKSKGGTNDDFNLVLATKEANTAKGDTYPYKRKDGKLLKGRPLKRRAIFPHLNLTNVNIRPEWEGILFIK